MTASLFCCPVCGGPLVREERAYRCAAGHSYDIAKEGYTYLLPPNRKHSADPGDDKAMSAARREFLSRGHYAPLRQTLIEAVAARTGETPVLLDAGCGEGYYTSGIRRSLAVMGRVPRMAGIDISKPILRLAAKQEPYVEFAVASCYHLPFPDEAADLLLDCFSPLAIDEFRRVLKPGGYFLYVVPGPRHLWELKEVLYDQPYLNEEKETPYDGFAYETILPVDFTLHLEAQSDIQALFRMTPYFWKTPKSGAERLAALDALDCQASFRVHVFQKR